MKVIVAGYNIDSDVILRMQQEHPEMQDLTPETVAAAYARISRSPRPVDELRLIARSEVERARQSNRNIVFEMGHSSIAEHAVFNIDIIGVSRLIVEEIEKFRLASYTEKSQRYVLLEDDFVVPGELADARLEKLFIDTVKEQNRLYHKLYEKLRPYVFEKSRELASDPKNRSLLEGWAKEDARYAISLATETQLGMTINARNLELMLRRLAAQPLKEGAHISRALYEAAGGIAPSLIRYTEATDYDRLTRTDLRDQAAERMKGRGDKETPQPAKLLFATPDADTRMTAHLLFSSSGFSFAQCMQEASGMSASEKEALIRTAFRRMKSYDAALREFENIDLHFELVISASCFAQMKRHRMATITCQDYDPALGVTVPAAVSETGMEGPFMDVMAHTEDAYDKIKKAAPPAAPYILTNAHRRRLIMKINARELYHISRLRADAHAQWDIRQIAERMVELGSGEMPLTLMLAAGKDGFSAVHDGVFASR